MSSSKKILVTGVAGFLGSHLSEKLVQLGHRVVGIDNMIGGYQDNVPKGVDFHNIDCCEIKKLKPVKGQEIHITDAIRSLIKKNSKFIAHKFKGKYLDCGTMSGYINSSKEIAKL